MKKPIISIAGLGGTICMSSQNDDGVKPTLSAEELILAVPTIKDIAHIKKAENLSQLPSGSLKLENLLEVIKWAKNEVKNGANGIVITQGTDSLEESAFFCNLFWDLKEPFVITGAMRNPTQVSSDGSANLLSSILVACNENSMNRGVLVTLNDTIHSGKWVAKSNTCSLNTFISVNGGIQGKVIESEVIFLNDIIKRKIFSIPTNLPKVAMCYSYLNDSGDIINFAKKNNYKGIVISSFGAGHVSKDMMDEITKIDKKDFEIIISSRTGSGKTANKTYGYYGSELTLVKNNAIMSQWLSPLKARLFLIALLANGYNHNDIKNEFKEF